MKLNSAPRKPSRLALVVIVAALASLSTHAQVVQEWTHSAPIAESSAAVAMDDRYMFVADNEDEVLRLYDRFPSGPCTAPVYQFNVRPDLGFGSSTKECDLEAAVKLVDGNSTLIYWLGSHSNNKNGNLRPTRERLFATQVSGDGTGSPAYALNYSGRYDRLRVDLVVWDQNNTHGLGANYFGFAASVAPGITPEQIDGFNMEGLVMAPDGNSAYLAFRSPLVNPAGPSTALEQRTHALIIPLLNMRALVAGQDSEAQFGPPILLDLGGRGVRSIDSSEPGQYLVTAGPPGDVSVTPSAPNNFRLFVWTGEAGDDPVESSTEIPAGYSPEGAMLAAGAITEQTLVQFVSDDGGGCWKSFTVQAGATLAPPPPRLERLILANGQTRLLVSGQPGSYRLEASTNLRDWNFLSTTNVERLPLLCADPDASHFASRFYRVYYEK